MGGTGAGSKVPVARAGSKVPVARADSKVRVARADSKVRVARADSKVWVAWADSKVRVARDGSERMGGTGGTGVGRQQVLLALAVAADIRPPPLSPNPSPA
ncbi:unnamed protein product [Closterium sp. Naga37s-1]|nr:unnamed protein product [Closterium sp. Naga37s-1]CAI5529621.1 unnamed protein product [Closterium sp. Naga37s-1]